MRSLTPLATALLLALLLSVPAFADEAPATAPVDEAQASSVESPTDPAEPLWLAKPTNRCEPSSETSQSYSWDYTEYLMQTGQLPDCEAWCTDQCTAQNGRVLSWWNNARNFTCECTCCEPK